jgi:hypothetical protein
MSAEGYFYAFVKNSGEISDASTNPRQSSRYRTPGATTIQCSMPIVRSAVLGRIRGVGGSGTSVPETASCPLHPGAWAFAQASV